MSNAFGISQTAMQKRILQVPVSSPTFSFASIGGKAAHCDQCQVTYCLDCSNISKASVVAHRGQSCGDHREAPNQLVRLKILDDLNLCCPRCKKIFLDFDGCFALACTCGAAFCGFCLQDCGEDAHPHVRKCELNPVPNEYFHSFAVFEQCHRKPRKQKTIANLMAITDTKIRSNVLKAIQRDLEDLQISISPQEVGC